MGALVNGVGKVFATRELGYADLEEGQNIQNLNLEVGTCFMTIIPL